MKTFHFLFIFSSLCLACQTGGGAAGDTTATGRLIDFQTQLDKLVPATEIARTAKTDVAGVSFHYDKTDDDPALHSYIGSWPSGKTAEIQTSDGKVNVSLVNTLGLGRFFTTTLTAFQDLYRQKSAIELKEQLSVMAKDTTIAPDMAIWEMREMVKKAKNTRFEKIEGPGEVAVWETPANALHVFSHDTAFSVFSSIDNDANLSKDRAVRLAEIILKRSEP